MLKSYLDVADHPSRGPGALTREPDSPVGDGILSRITNRSCRPGTDRLAQAAQAHGYPGSIEQRISLITLGVSDPTRSRAFYEALGWRGQEVEETVFFQLGGMVLVLWDRRKLAADAGVEDRAAGGFGGITLAHNVRTAGEVDELLALVEAAGATVTKPPATTFYGGYAGCFCDPEGHIWEIAHNPGFSLGPDGSLVLPDFGADD